ncbi:MAG: dephospho-CoA kinase [Halofilum sp. (in: g-proteobacteria)]|nr:dephospho-CoA kinase [Halofilum sp. (in: g-proteobacteria)]
MLRVCLTGGIASGKSLVSEHFRALGVPVADSDIAARAVVEPGSPGLERVVEAFGEGVLAEDGSLDRRALRKHIFSDARARARLEEILHPLIRARLEQELSAWAEAGTTYALQSVPLLVETGQYRDCARVLVVDAPVAVQVERLIRRDRSTESEAQSIIGQQASRWKRLSVATDVIDNGDGVDPNTAITPQVLALHRKYSTLAARVPIHHAPAP